jgi:hypoxanthine phosphoribosyltransferase
MLKQIKSNEEIKFALAELANIINYDYKDIKCLDIICFINGASIFCSDLIRLLDIPSRVHHFGFTPYQDLPKNGEVKIEHDLKHSIQGRDVLILEGLVISGRTPLYLLNFFKSRNPKTLKFCALGIKKQSIEVDMDIDYHIYEFKNEWVEGYGIGNNDNKSLPYLVDIREES